MTRIAYDDSLIFHMIFKTIVLSLGSFEVASLAESLAQTMANEV